MTGPARASRSINVLLVDDHQIILDSFVKLLAGDDDIHLVATAATCADALDAAARYPVDVMVMDYQLPDGNGVTAAEQVQQMHPDVKVIILTGSELESASFEADQGHCAGSLDWHDASAKLSGLVRSVFREQGQLPAHGLAILPEMQDLVVQYQPIMDLASEGIVGYEALVRWDHPDRGLLAPADFIDLAERTGSIMDIDEHVRLVACQQAVDWQTRFPSSPARFMSVNLSGRELQSAGATDRLAAAVEASGLAPSSLVIELTETFLVDNVQSQAARLAELHAFGFRIALDDFGTAYSSLDYLYRLPIDIIKIDKSFVDQLPHGERAVSLLGAVSHLADEMHAVCEAEGIESAEQVSRLRMLGYQYGQGYHFAKPMPAEAMETMLALA